MTSTRVESLHAGPGQRVLDFLRISADDFLRISAGEGPVGWSEYNESFGGPGVGAVIDRLAPALVGRDPGAHEAIMAHLQALRRPALGGVVQQAFGAIENALLDVKARALSVPVYGLLGGPARDRIRLHWSHCGTYRVSWAGPMQLPAVRTLDDLVAVGQEVVARGASPSSTPSAT